MFQVIAAVQPLLLGAVLIWAAAVKLLSRRAAAAAHRSALVSLIGQRRVVPAYRLLGGVELTVGTLLVLPPAPRVEAVGATALCVGFLGYLGYARTVAPGSSCGCLSSRRTPVSWRGFGRSGMLVLAGLVATFAAGDWLRAVAGRPFVGVPVLLVEAATVVALSPELDSTWLLPLRRLRAHLTHPLRGGSGVPLLSTVQQLQQSDVYRRVAPLLSSDVREHWDDEEWRMVCHAARYQGRGATAVFAVPRLRYEPDAVRVALVDDLTGVTLLNLEAAPEPTSSCVP